MSSIDKWIGIGDKIDFKVTLYYGGGLGDLIHRIYDSEYLKRLRSIKQVFPNLYIYLKIDTDRSIETAKQLFEKNPYINEIIAYNQTPFNNKIYNFASELLGKRKNEIGCFLPDLPNEVVFQRIVNRVYELLAFPRVRSITMDDFFQQLKLNINDFEEDDPFIYLTEDEERYGKELKKKMCPNGEKMIGVHFFTVDKKRIINPSLASDTIKLLIEGGYKVSIIGSENESKPDLYEGHLRDIIYKMRFFKDDPNVAYLCDGTGVRHKISVIKNCDGMVLIDGGFMHCAWINKIPSIALINGDWIDRFNHPAGFWWALAQKKTYADYILLDKEKSFDLSLIRKKLSDFGL